MLSKGGRKVMVLSLISLFFLPFHFVVHFLFAYFLFSNHELLKETFQVDLSGDHK